MTTMTELESLRAQNADLLLALQQAEDALGAVQSSHGKVLTSYPPRDAWLENRVDEKVRNAIAAIAAAQAAQADVRDALTRWWEEKRPFNWPESEHIENPEINCTGAEKPLALLAVALRTTSTDSEKGGGNA